MRTVLSFLYLFMFFISAGYSQADSSRVFKTHALQFRMSSLLSLSSFKGAFISYKYHPQDDHAFRFGISLNGQKTSDNEKRDYLSADTIYFNQDRNRNNYSIECVVEYLKYLNPQDDLKMFVGIGPRLYLQIYNYTTDNIQSEYYSYDKDYKSDSYRIGVACSYGVEWFFRDNMSLHAEYGFNFSYVLTKYNRTRVYPHENSPDGYEKNSSRSSGFEIDDSSALLGLSLYF